MEKTLILSCSTGQGHNSCAQAIEEYFEKYGVDCDILDALDFISVGISKFISWGHSCMYRHLPKVFQWGYRYSEVHPEVFGEHSGIYKLLTAGGERLYTYIVENQYDTVICTHVFSAMILTHILKAHPLDVKTAFVATDYTCSPSTEASDLEYYFIPDGTLYEEYEKSGISRERMIVSGIPVRSVFNKQVERADAKRLLGIKADHRHLLIMCGSMGCGPVSKMVKRISKRMPLDMDVSVICGTNGALKRKLEKAAGRNDRIHIIGYTSEISLYLDSADLYLTKPGGISVTEAAGKHLPMAFVNAVAGCESYNMKFFLEKGAAVTADSPVKLVEECIRLLYSDEERIRMENALWEYRQPEGAAGIYWEMKGGVCA